MQQLLMLARRHEIHFLSFVSNESEQDLRLAHEELGGVCASVHTVPMALGKLDVLRAKLRFVTGLTPVDADLFDSPAMARQLSALLASIQPDLVMPQFPQMAQYLPQCGDAATAFDVQDAFSVSGYRKFRAQRGVAGRLKMFFNWLSWLSYEARYYPRADVVFTLTDQDRVALEVFSPGLGAEVVPAAVALEPLAQVAVAADTIGFIGSFSHTPNVEGIRYFIDDVLPLIVARRPAARLIVAGGNPPQQLLALSGAHVEFVGFVPDANVFMRSTAVVVVPLLSGGGIKIKTLHAMACACPLVSTSIGVEEIGVVDDVHGLVANTPQRFADQVLALLDDPQRGARLGAAARELIIGRFSEDAKAAALERIVELARVRRQARRRREQRIR